MQKSISRLRNIFYHSSSRTRTVKKDSIKLPSNNLENFDPDSNFVDQKIWLSKSLVQSKKVLNPFNKTTHKHSTFNSTPFKNIALRHHLEIDYPLMNVFWIPRDIQKAKIPIRNVAYANMLKKGHHTKNKNLSDISDIGIELNKKRSAFSSLNNNYNPNLHSTFLINDHDSDFKINKSSKKIISFNSFNNCSLIKKPQVAKPLIEEKDEQIVFKINPYIDSSSKYLLNNFQNQYLNYLKNKSHSNYKKLLNMESVIRKMIPILFLKFPENKSFFRKIINHPINIAKTRALNEKLENNRKISYQKKNQTTLNSRRNMFVKIKRKEAPNGNDRFIHSYTRTQNNFNQFKPKSNEINWE